jgi:CheY-like chemotaxis protein
MSRTSSELVVLVVDDDQGHCELIKRNFRRIGIANPIEMVHSGADALDFALRRGRYSQRDTGRGILILLDINMPGTLSGLDVLNELKSNPETCRIPIIMLTTAEDPREVDQCYSLGCTFYLQKPVESSRFMETIRGLGLLISVVRLPTGQISRLAGG